MNPRQLMHEALRDEWDGLERITRDLRAADAFTLLNAFAGAVALMFATAGHHGWASAAILTGVVLDGTDGAVARIGRRWGGGPLGPPLDSLADGVTFVAAPAILAVAWAGGLGAPWWAMAAAALYLAAGLLRLARFENLRGATPTRYFSGLPTPAGSMFVVAAVGVPGASVGLVAAVAAVAGLLMASRVRYPKLRRLPGALAGIVILASILALVWLGQPAPAAWALLVSMVLFLLAGPFYVLLRVGPTPAPETAR